MDTISLIPTPIYHPPLQHTQIAEIKFIRLRRRLRVCQWMNVIGATADVA
jgi:hypothetical protein